jgi:hypothetical protein
VDFRSGCGEFFLEKGLITFFTAERILLEDLLRNALVDIVLELLQEAIVEKGLFQNGALDALELILDPLHQSTSILYAVLEEGADYFVEGKPTTPEYLAYLLPDFIETLQSISIRIHKIFV